MFGTTFTPNAGSDIFYPSFEMTDFNMWSIDKVFWQNSSVKSYLWKLHYWTPTGSRKFKKVRSEHSPNSPGAYTLILFAGL